MKQGPHSEIGNGCSDPDCDGIVRRNGWTYVGIDGATRVCPSWKCDKCGAEFWSYFDTDNGDESYDFDDDDDSDDFYDDYGEDEQ